MIIFLLFTQIDSLSLNQAIDLALKKNPTYYESKANLDQSRIQYYQSLFNLLPTVLTTGRYTNRADQGVTTKTYSGDISLSVPIFDLEVLSAIGIAGLGMKSTNIQHQADISNVIRQLKTAYYGLINGQQLLKSSEIAIARAQENQKLVDTKYALGTASRLDVLQAQVFYLQSLENELKAQTQVMNSQENLKSLLDTKNNIYPTDTLARPEPIEFPNLDSLITIMQKVNYSIRAARGSKDISKVSLIAASLAFLPKVSFFYGYNVSSDSLIFDFQYYQDNAARNYGINVSLPIFEVKSLIFNYLKAKKDLQAKTFAEKRAILEAQQSLRTAYYTLKENMAKLELNQKSLEAASEAAAIAQEQYVLGTISFLDYLRSEEDLYNARVSYSSALSDFYIQQANFSYLIGQLTLNKE